MTWDNLTFFPDGLMNLQAELATGLHPEVEKLLTSLQCAPNDWEIRLARIAAYVGIIVDGQYGTEEISQLAATCAGRLEVLREIPRAQKILPLN